MSTDKTQSNSQQSNESIHPICRNSKTPEKCAEFADKLDQVNSSLKLTDSVATRLYVDGKS